MTGRARIDGQNQAYRRGLVMGLTMAEVGILIIFVLLLLIAWAALKHSREATGRWDMESIGRQDLASLRSSEETLRRIAQALGLAADVTPREISELIRAVQEASATPQGSNALQSAKQSLQVLQETKESLRKVLEEARIGGADAVLERVETQAFDLSMKDGQLEFVKSRLDALGNGGGERPCWVEPDGSVRFLYDVLLTSHGLRMRERSGIEAVRSRFPLPSVDPEVEMTEEQFLRLTQPLYDYGRSDERQCRFHVWIYDGTDAGEKALYKQEIKTVEGHFYRQYKVSDGALFN
jgi:hypothetical protein